VNDQAALDLAEAVTAMQTVMTSENPHAGELPGQ
jgi:hypothetical protein